MKKIVFALLCLLAVAFMFSCGEKTLEKETFTVSFDSDGGTDVESQEVEPGEQAEEPEDPEKENHEFLGWYLKNKKYNFKKAVESDITLKAKWEPIEYEVRFNSDGGTMLEPVSVVGGESLERPNDPTKENYTFVGWFLDGEEYDFSTPVTEDVTLTAKWEEVVIPDDEIFTKMQSVLLLGQSNMVGIGDPLTVEKISDERLYMMRDDTWQQMHEPLHTNTPRAGIGIGASFGKAFVETFDCKLGLIPAAEGATSLADWAVGGRLYNEAIRLAKIAQKNSEICAILWHQGEGNQNTRDYADQFKVIINAMIKDLGLDKEKIVIITGELYGTRGDNVHTQQLNYIGKSYKNYGVASSDGLTTIDVDTHFDAPSLRVFGYRYFDIFYNCITGKNYEFDDNPESYRTAPERDDGEITTFDFEDMAEASLYANALCGNGKIYSSNYSGNAPGIVKVEKHSTYGKYLVIGNAYDETNKKYTSTYVNAEHLIAPSSVVVIEAKFMLGADSASAANILMLYNSDLSAMYQSIYMAENGDIYSLSKDDLRGDKIGKITADSWTSIRVIMDLENNVKDIYVDDELVVRAAKISMSDTSNVTLDLNRLVQFVPGNATGTIMLDDYKCYLYADSIAPGK